MSTSFYAICSYWIPYTSINLSSLIRARFWPYEKKEVDGSQL